jgi:hypothetical protein
MVMDGIRMGDKIGCGGQSEVFECTVASTPGTLAAKVIKPTLAQDS